jgi:hypothetical protein
MRLLLLGLISSALLTAAGCNQNNLVVDPPEAFGLSGVISFCKTREVNYTIACRAYEKANISSQLTGPEYVLFFPSNTAMTAYLNSNSLTEETFLNSAGLVEFIRKHIASGALANGVTLTTLGSTQVSVTTTANGFVLNSSILAIDFPVAKKVENKLWLYAIDKALIQ